MGAEIKVEFCVAYDWYYLEYALPLVYAEADRICLSLDAARCSWAGLPFAFDEAGFRSLVARLDVAGKIDVYEDDFHRPELTPMQNENRQRQLMAERLGPGGWHVQLDADEYFLDFAGFAAWLRRQRPGRPVNIRCAFVTLFKKVDSGYLLVDQNDYFNFDIHPIATNNPQYIHGRITPWFNMYAPYYIIHQTWAREEGEIEQKISNWGHKNDFDVQKYFNFWGGLTSDNYKKYTNFHPLLPEQWAGLKLVSAYNIKDLIRSLDNNYLPMPSSYKINLKNSIWLSRIKYIINKITS